MASTTDSLTPDAEPVETKRGTCPICGVGCFVETKLVAGKPVSIRPDRSRLAGTRRSTR